MEAIKILFPILVIVLWGIRMIIIVSKLEKKNELNNRFRKELLERIKEKERIARSIGWLGGIDTYENLIEYIINRSNELSLDKIEI